MSPHQLGAWQVDTRRWPIAIYSLDEGATLADLDSFIAEGDAILARRERYVAVLDASRLRRVAPPVRSRAIAWQKENRALLAEYCVATAFVLTSPVLRFVTMTVLLLTDLPTPYRIFASVDEAVAWAEQRLVASTPAEPR